MHLPATCLPLHTASPHSLARRPHRTPTPHPATPVPRTPHAPRPSHHGNEEHHLVRVFEASDEFISNHLRSCREGRTRYAPHATRHAPMRHARTSQPSQVRLSRPSHRILSTCLQAHGLRSARAGRGDRREAVRYAEQLPLPTHTPRTHTTAHGRALGCEEMCSRRSTYFWPSHIC